MLLGVEGPPRNEWVMQVSTGLAALHPLVTEGGSGWQSVKLKLKVDPGATSAIAVDVSANDVLLMLGAGVPGTARSREDAARVRDSVVVSALHRLRRPNFLPDGKGSVCIRGCTQLLCCTTSYFYHAPVADGA